ELARVQLALPGRAVPGQGDVLEQERFLELGAEAAQREAVVARRGHAQLEVAVRVERGPIVALDLEPAGRTELRRPADGRALVDAEVALEGETLGRGV